MKNDDLISFIQPVPNRFHSLEWRDATGTIQDIFSDAEALTVRANLAAGRYRGYFTTKRDAFDMRSAMVEMTRVPDGEKIRFGPWDLDHLNNVMAIPMALVAVNGIFRGGLWFTMPGPDQIAAGILTADFGFEHDGEELELTLTLSPRDKERFDWSSLDFLEIRNDDRRTLDWKPQSTQRPRFFTAGLDRKALAEKLRLHPGFSEARARLDPPVNEWKLFHGQNDGVFDLACLIGYATSDAEILSKAKAALLSLCRADTWSGRPDPLLMGGENDRGLGFKLSVAGVGWEFLRDVLTEDERQSVLGKAEEYLRKMYDFTILQRGYMGCPTPDAHSLSTWWGVGTACLAFYDELAIARKALPFFHALIVDSLGMFSPSGKAPLATYYPIWLARYFAAAIEFGGRMREVDESPFFENLAGALLTSFRSPNSQEMQRGLRTIEHRALMAFLKEFHSRPEVDAIYAAFVEEERRDAGDVHWGMFDLLYGPVESVAPEEFRSVPLFARDTGDILITAGPRRVNLQINGGIKSGGKNSFRLQSHNREYPRTLGDFILSVGGNPMIIRLNSSYGLFSAQRNALCFEEGCMEGEGQYLHGQIPPERVGYIRRFCLNDRFLYADVNFTASLKPQLGVRYAQRIFLVDRKTGVIVIHDLWESESPLKVSTHLHCAGRAMEESQGCYLLTGGQANTIAGIKFGDMGMPDEERAEIFVHVLGASGAWNAKVEEPFWFPSYIYGLNGNPGQKVEDARYPRLKRWRLELNERVQAGNFLLALSPDKENLAMRDGQVSLPESAVYHLGDAVGETWRCTAEAVIQDLESNQVMAIGATRWRSGEREINFRVPVDMCCDVENLSGVIHSPSEYPVHSASGFKIGTPANVPNHARSLFTTELTFEREL